MIMKKENWHKKLRVKAQKISIQIIKQNKKDKDYLKNKKNQKGKKILKFKKKKKLLNKNNMKCKKKQII